MSICKSVYTQSELLPNGIVREIECDIEEKWMKVRTKSKDNSEWTEMNLSKFHKVDVIDLNENGDRWEGDSLNGLPFGYGFIYNSENQIIYKGFIYEGMKVCYGSDMYEDAGITEYEGGYYKNRRYGYGRLYDKMNELVYEGEWYSEKPNESLVIQIEGELKEEDFNFGLEEIVINGCMDSIECFQLIGFSHLNKLVIEKGCLKRMKCFSIEECNELIDLELNGDRVRVYYDDEEEEEYDDDGDDGDDDDEDDEDDEDEDNEDDSTVRLFRVTDCKNLRNISIDYYWYVNNTSVVIQSTLLFYVMFMARSS